MIVEFKNAKLGVVVRYPEAFARENEEALNRDGWYRQTTVNVEASKPPQIVKPPKTEKE